MTLIVGLSGGIGTGKTTVGQRLVELGATLVDADAIVHELQAAGSPLLAELADAFGPEILDADGALDRAALGGIVFRDPDARGRLGAIMHPPVIAEMERRRDEAIAKGVPVVVLDIPLLFEGRKSGTGAGALLHFDVTVLVYATPALQVERQIERNGYPRDEAERRVASQMPIDDKKALADVVVDNSGALAETLRQVDALYAEWMSRSRG